MVVLNWMLTKIAWNQEINLLESNGWGLQFVAEIKMRSWRTLIGSIELEFRIASWETLLRAKEQKINRKNVRNGQ